MVTHSDAHQSGQPSANPEIGGFVQAGSVSTNVHVAGEGEPLVLLHGSGPGVSAWANWRLNIPEFARHSKVYAPDILGFGYTERPADVTYGMEQWLRHLTDILDALDIDRTSFVGNSFGGALALNFAARHPERVDRLVLMGSAGVRFELTPGLDAVWGYEPSIDNMRRLLDIFAYDRALVTDELAEIRYQASIREGVQEAYASMFPAPRQRWIDAMAVNLEVLARLEVPTLIIHGGDDDVVPADTAKLLFETLPNRELHMFGQCGHWTQIEKRDRFNALVSSFLSAPVQP